MPNRGKSFIRQALLIILLAAGAAAVFYFRHQLLLGINDLSGRLRFVARTQLDMLSPPCQQPILYSLGEIDPKFGVSSEELLSAIDQAAGTWSKPLGRQLFAYATSGELKIKMTYDYRQEATDKLKSLGIDVSDSQKAYDSLKSRYDDLNAEFLVMKDQLTTAAESFKSRQAAYEAEVAKWNSQGGAPPATYDRLNAARLDLNAEVARINGLSAKVNDQADMLNAEGTVLNKLIEQLNLNVARYNNAGAATGKEFQEGVYEDGPDGRSITVYEFSSRDQLVRLLSHELGHALGLEHSSGTEDIMYYLNQGKNKAASEGDVAALKAKCRL